MSQLVLVLLLPQTHESGREKVFFPSLKINIFFLLLVNSRKAILKLYMFFQSAVFDCTDKHHDKCGLVTDPRFSSG